MIEQLRFYANHSWNDLRVNGQRTLFALLCIASGVAAIVSLQTLAVMIGDTLTGNLQENNRGDIIFEAGNEFFEGEDVVKTGVEEGVLREDVISFFGQQNSFYYVSEDGFSTIEAWAEENFPGRAQFTYDQPITTDIDIFFGNGNGAGVSDPETGEVVNQTIPRIIDPNVYPFYSEVLTQDGQVLGDIITEPTDIVISEQIAAQLDVGVGDRVRLVGASEDFTVRGIVDTGTEVKSPGQDTFLALFGYYYLDLSARELFDDVPVQASTVYVQLDDVTPDLVNDFNARFQERFPYLETTTTEDLRQSYTDFSEAIDQLVTIMGLVSMLIGSIGIVNTMQVIVRRRTVEIAVLKTIGLQANQITVLFLVEALIMGLIGSIVGIILGWLATFVIRGAAETLLATDLPFQIALMPVVNGLIIGVLVTAIFGLLPTLTAGQVRPGIVLRPSDNIVPRAGLLRTLLALLVIIFVLTIIAQSILGDTVLAIAVILGSFVAVLLLYFLLNLMVWLVGRFFPSLGFIDLKISLRQMLAGRTRAAMTLLALVIGVFSLSLITLFSRSITELLEFALDDAAGGNIAITLSNYGQLDQIESIVQGQEGVNSYEIMTNYGVELISIEESDGTVLDLDAIEVRLEEAAAEDFSPFAPPQDFDRLQLLLSQLGTIDALRVEDIPQKTMTDGRNLTTEDQGQPLMILNDNDLFSDAGITVGDKIIFEIQQPESVFGLGGEPEPIVIEFEVAGMAEATIIEGGFSSMSYALLSAFPEDLDPTGTNLIVDIVEEYVPELRREVSAIPGTFVLDTAIITQLINSLLGTFTAFPSMVAALGLVVGGVVIANSVALTTMERRKEIAVMKAVGLQRERVLGMILLENGVMGVIGGLIGVGIGVVGLIVMLTTLSVPPSTVPWGAALLLMGLCILVALIAAITTAWGASGEKPLNVLRYE